MKFLVYSCLILSNFSFFGQDLKCEDLRNGTFIATLRDFPDVEYEIVRRGNSQVETVTKIPQELIDAGYPVDSKVVNIEWIDDCSYVLTADESEGELDEVSRIMNEYGGVKTAILKIENNCFHYKTTLIIDGEAISSFGKLCKMNEF